MCCRCSTRSFLDAPPGDGRTAQTDAPGLPTSGHASITLGVNQKVCLVAGMDLGTRHITAGIADLTGSFLGTVTRPSPTPREPIETLSEAVDMLDELLARSDRPRGV